MDVQGYELNVLKGAVETLKDIDYIWTEVNYEELYNTCALMEDLDAFLEPLGFKRMFNSDYGGWGDAYYKKIK
jgi:hypothetical protein